MSTHALVAVGSPDNSSQSMYVHLDGDYVGLGKILRDHYPTREDAQRLISEANGDLSHLTPNGIHRLRTDDAIPGTRHHATFADLFVTALGRGCRWVFMCKGVGWEAYRLTLDREGYTGYDPTMPDEPSDTVNVVFSREGEPIEPPSDEAIARQFREDNPTIHAAWVRLQEQERDPNSVRIILTKPTAPIVAHHRGEKDIDKLIAIRGRMATKISRLQRGLDALDKAVEKLKEGDA